MEISIESVIAMLAKIAAADGNEVASNVLITAEAIRDQMVQLNVVQSVADGLGVSLV